MAVADLQLESQASLATTDTMLVARARSGDGLAFEAIMRRFNRRLYRLARSIVRDEAEAEDVVQEAYVTAYIKLASFVGPHGLGAWLSRITVNLALGRLRRSSRHTSLDGTSETGQLDLDTLLADLGRVHENPEANAATAELRKLLEEAIDGLPAHFRVVFMLRAVEGLSVAETAAILELRPETVKTRFHRARNLLQRALSERVQSVLGGLFPFAGARCDRIVEAVRTRLALGVPREDVGLSSS
jgi:RNA polymerase sigma-70 factor (ECF subfamily)